MESKMDDEENRLTLEKQSEKYMVPEYSIYVDENLVFNIQVFGWRLLNNITKHSSLKTITISDLINELQSYELCSGVDKEHMGKTKIIAHSIPVKFTVSLNMDEPFLSNMYFRTIDCEILTNNSICLTCATFLKMENAKESKKLKKSQEPLKPRAPLTGSSKERLALTLKQNRLETKNLVNENDMLHGHIAYLMNEIHRINMIRMEHYIPCTSGGSTSDHVDKQNFAVSEEPVPKQKK